MINKANVSDEATIEISEMAEQKINGKGPPHRVRAGQFASGSNNSLALSSPIDVVRTICARERLSAEQTGLAAVETAEGRR